MNSFSNTPEERKACLIALIGALQELSHWPDLAKTQFFVTKDEKLYAVPPDDVQPIFLALRQHAERMYPWAVRIIEDAHRLEAVEHQLNEVKTKFEEQSHYLLADEERRKLTGDAIFAEGELVKAKRIIEELQVQNQVLTLLLKEYQFDLEKIRNTQRNT